MSEGKRNREYSLKYEFDFEEFYFYCEQYYLKYGNLDIGGHCMVKREADGTVTFLKNATPEEKENCVCDIGRKLKIVRENLISMQTEGKLAYPTIKALTQEQIKRLDNLAVGWQMPGQTTFNQFYMYCEIFYNQFGNLAVPLQHMALLDKNGNYHFKDYHEITLEEQPLVVYSLGDKMRGYVRLFNNGGNRKRSLTKEQIDMLSMLDPYWYYPRCQTGERIDPETGKSVDASRAYDTNHRSEKAKSIFDFERFYSYALLYYTKYNSLYANVNTVVIKREDGSLDFVRREEVSDPSVIVYRLGAQFSKIINPKRTSAERIQAKLNKAYKLLTDEQYQKLESLDSNWYVTTSDTLSRGTQDPVSAKWLEGKVQTPKTVQRESPPAEKTVDTAYLSENAVEEETDERCSGMKDFEIFYSFCKAQKEMTGSLEFSRAKVVTLKDKKTEYPLGRIFHNVSEYRYYKEQVRHGIECDPVTIPAKLKLNDEQNKQMDELDKFWFYPRSIQRMLRVQEIRERREAMRQNSEQDRKI